MKHKTGKRPAFHASLLLLLLPAAAAAAAPGAADPNGGLPPDIKTLALETYGVRGAVAIGPTNLVVALGASSTGARGAADGWRITSETDPAYRYESFVMPVAGKTIADAVEFPFPEDFEVPWPADRPLRRQLVLLDLPSPLRPGEEYGLVAIGSGGSLVTAAKSGCLFSWSGRPFDGDPKSIRVPADETAPRMVGLRRVSPVGDGKLVLEFGGTFSTSGGSRAANYAVRVNGKAAPVTGLGRRSRIDVYLPEGWPFRTILQHDVFLDVGRELRPGDRVEISVSDAVCSGVREGGFTFQPDATVSRSIQANQVGYLPDAPKVAYLGCWMGSFPEREKPTFSAANAPSPAEFFAPPAAAAPAAADAAAAAAGYDELAPYALRFREPPAFDLVRESDGRAVFSGRAALVHNGLEPDGNANHSGSNVYVLDFTAFDEPGRYHLRVPGVGRSLAFDIGPDVYARAFRAQAAGLYAQRCGFALDPAHAPGWRRIACHTNGVQLSTVKRWTVGEFGPFRETPVLVPNPRLEELTARMRALDADPALVARFPLEGDARNAVAGSKITLAPIGEGNEWTADKEFGTKVLVSGAKDNGFRGDGFAVDPAAGATVSFWMRRDDAAGNKWAGDVFRCGADGTPGSTWFGPNWGFLQLDGSAFSRVGDNVWRHYVLRMSPAAGDGGDVRWELIVDRERCNDVTHAPPASPAFTFAAIGDEAAPGTHFRDLRLYARALSDDEVGLLATRIRKTVPATIPLAGGHHDAGDYNPRSHLDVAQLLLSLWEQRPDRFRDGQLDIPEAGNGLPDVVDEALWALRVWTALQDDDGGVRAGTESDGDPAFHHPVELDPKGDFAFDKDCRASFNAAGAFAQASRVLRTCGRKEDADGFLDRARRAYAWGVAHVPDGIASAPDYADYRYVSRAYAAAELLHATGEKKFLDDFRAYAPWGTHPDAPMYVYGRYDASEAAYAFLRIPQRNPDPALRDAVRAAVVREADSYIAGSDKMAYKFIRHPDAPIVWGVGAYSVHIRPVLAAWFATRDRKYRDWIVRSCDNTLGANPMGLSWIVGLGERTIRAPLHNSRYRPAGVVADGMQSEGPSARAGGYNYNETVYPEHRDDFAPLHEYADCHFAIAMDEGVVRNQVLVMAVFGTLLP